MKQFDAWNGVKKHTQNRTFIHQFKERDIFITTLGNNIGFEEDGKGTGFLRPVVILKKFSNQVFLGIPLTSQAKDDKFHFIFNYTEEKESYAILSQIRLFDAKRLERKSGVIDKDNFSKMKERILKLYGLEFPSAKAEGCPEGIKSSPKMTS